MKLKPDYFISAAVAVVTYYFLTDRSVLITLLAWFPVALSFALYRGWNP